MSGDLGILNPIYLNVALSHASRLKILKKDLQGILNLKALKNPILVAEWFAHLLECTKCTRSSAPSAPAQH